MSFPVTVVVVNLSQQQTMTLLRVLISAGGDASLQPKRRFSSEISWSWIYNSSYTRRRTALCVIDSLCFPFSLHHSYTKIKGWLRNSQSNWFPHEDDPISPQWDFVLCVQTEWESSCPGLLALAEAAHWHQCINGLLAKRTAVNLPSWWSEITQKFNPRWESSDKDQIGLKLTETHVTASASSLMHYCHSSVIQNITFNYSNTGSINRSPAEDKTPFCFLIEIHRNILFSPAFLSNKALFRQR